MFDYNYNYNYNYIITIKGTSTQCIMWYAHGTILWIMHEILLMAEIISVPAKVNWRANSSVRPAIANCRVSWVESMPTKLPTRKRHRRKQQLTSNLPGISSLTLPQLKALPAMVLRLDLSSRYLITAGSITTMASLSHSMLHKQQSGPSPTTSVTSQTVAPPLTQL